MTELQTARIQARSQHKLRLPHIEIRNVRIVELRIEKNRRLKSFIFILISSFIIMFYVGISDFKKQSSLTLICMINSTAEVKFILLILSLICVRNLSSYSYILFILQTRYVYI